MTTSPRTTIVVTLTRPAGTVHQSVAGNLHKPPPFHPCQRSASLRHAPASAPTRPISIFCRADRAGGESKLVKLPPLQPLASLKPRAG